MANIEKLKQTLIDNSISKDWDVARLEWGLYSIIKSSEKSSCVCGATIKNIFSIFNKGTGEVLNVGSDCIKNINPDYDNIYEYLQNILLDHNKRPNQKLVKYCYDNEIINEDEFIFCNLLSSKTNLRGFKDLQSLRSKINQKILAHFDSSIDFNEDSNYSLKQELNRFASNNAQVISKMKANAHNHIENNSTEFSENTYVTEDDTNDMKEIFQGLENKSSPAEIVNNVTTGKLIGITQTEPPNELGTQSQQSLKPLTLEQNAIVSCNDNVVLINAFAGTGKTSTLLEFAKRRPDWSIWYIAYNKSMQVEAEKRFPSNVKCRTLHSIAYEYIGRKFSSGKIGTDRIYDLCEHLNIKTERVATVKNATNLLNVWFNSSFLELDERIFPAFLATISLEDQDNYPFITLKYLLGIAKNIWRLMQDLESDVKMSHDGYLKLYHLSKPVFNCDCVLLDEAQDSNDVTISIVENGLCRNKVIVGDIHQAIYQFRGTKNALQDFITTHNKPDFPLTTSFRFNQIIGGYASKILKYFKGETRAITGLGRNGSIYKIDGSINEIILGLEKGTTILARKNASLFKLAIHALTQGKIVYFEGGIQKYDIALLSSICELETGQESGKIKHNFISKFRSFYDLESYAGKAKESDLKILTKLVKDNGGSHTSTLLKKLVDMDRWINKDLTNNLWSCDFQLTTAHRSKGLEFKRVAIWPDFDGLYEIALDSEKIKLYRSKSLDDYNKTIYEQEINLYYVAVTRAKEKLILINNPLLNILPYLHKEYFDAIEIIDGVDGLNEITEEQFNDR